MKNHQPQPLTESSSVNDILKTIATKRVDLQKLKNNLALGKQKDFSQIRKTKRLIARHLTRLSILVHRSAKG